MERRKRQQRQTPSAKRQTPNARISLLPSSPSIAGNAGIADNVGNELKSRQQVLCPVSFLHKQNKLVGASR